MSFQVVQSIPGRQGGIYAYRGDVLEDDDPMALRNPNRVCAVDAPVTRSWSGREAKTIGGLVSPAPAADEDAEAAKRLWSTRPTEPEDDAAAGGWIL